MAINDDKQKRIEIINSIRTEAGGFTKKDLAAIGVSWPPKKGWLKKYVNYGTV